MHTLDSVIHQPVRLRVMASLCSIGTESKLEFTHLRDLLEVTDGNLGAHLAKLEDAGYVTMEKSFVARKPRTYLSATSKGRAAFDEHVAALRQILAPAPQEG